MWSSEIDTWEKYQYELSYCNRRELISAVATGFLCYRSLVSLKMVWLIFPWESVTNASMIGPPYGQNQRYSESVGPKRLLWKPRRTFSRLVRNDVLWWNDYIVKLSYINRVNKPTWKYMSFHINICGMIDTGQDEEKQDLLELLQSHKVLLLWNLQHLYYNLI